MLDEKFAFAWVFDLNCNLYSMLVDILEYSWLKVELNSHSDTIQFFRVCAFVMLKVGVPTSLGFHLNGSRQYKSTTQASGNDENITGFADVNSISVAS